MEDRLRSSRDLAVYFCSIAKFVYTHFVDKVTAIDANYNVLTEMDTHRQA